MSRGTSGCSNVLSCPAFSTLHKSAFADGLWTFVRTGDVSVLLDHVQLQPIGMGRAP